MLFQVTYILVTVDCWNIWKVLWKLGYLGRYVQLWITAGIYCACSFIGFKDDDLHPEEQAKETANDERRWKLADRNEDGVLSKDEFSNLIHPEEAPHMRESLIQVLTTRYMTLIADDSMQYSLQISFVISSP